MPKTRTARAVTLVLVVALVGTAPVSAATGIAVRDGRLVEGNGTELVLRGVNHPHAWYRDRLAALGHAKALGANSVRVVLASGQRWERTPVEEVGRIVEECERQRLVCVLEVHDTTGYGEQAGAATLAQAVEFWRGVRGVLEGTEDHVIVNIGNEPFGDQGHERWAVDSAAAIRALREAGFAHTLMVDGPNWGQDWTFTMRDGAAEVFAADPAGNTVFSIHMYGVFSQASTIRAYLDAFEDAGLPLVIGEFGHDHSDGDPDEDAILAEAEARGLGYLGWSWSGNGGGVEYLDMVEGFDPERLTPWGERIFDGPNGVAATSREATTFGGGPSAPPAEGPSAPAEPEPQLPVEEPPAGEPPAPAPERAATSWWSRILTVFRAMAAGG
jgi:mannan endo-1,4-beta-mannosidase